MQYRVLAASLHGKRPQPFKEGDIIEAEVLNAGHIPELLKSKFIEEYIAPAKEAKKAEEPQKP